MPIVKIEVQPNPPPLLASLSVAKTREQGGGEAKYNQQYKKKGETAVSQGLNTFVLLMYSHLTREQRYVIYLELQRRTSQKAIAQLIGVSKSTVSREIRRNSTPNGKYVWVKAQDRADGRKKRKPGNRKLPSVLCWRIRQLTNPNRFIRLLCANETFFFVIYFVTSRLQWNPIAPSKWQNICSKTNAIIIITLMTDLG